ncbi:DUF1284 domain-containing protein [Clostridium sp. ZS1]|uniref:DUF1284 domain-containing protein n=1 Tax=Clostridium sp. ZS1 TaxID=2949989 RepID=UPI0013FBD6DC|nr:DUF1284 domain-containing protein [Clostridium sp. ZS1]MBN1040359.1 hypothetical protein [Clostridium botulinum]NFI56021.1 hypothetical protein [Clostridium botulinum]
MESITIKPHHFMDIIKLYGAGIKTFIPDEKMGHDFYKVANTIITNPTIELNLTIQADDICKPCKMCKNNICVDVVEHIEGYNSKYTYNETLDRRLIHLLNLDIDKLYKAQELCQIMLENHKSIFMIWREESNTMTIRRHDMFVLGARQYLDNTNSNL